MLYSINFLFPSSLLFLFMQGINTYIQEIEELCTDYPATTVIFDHMAFCKPPMYACVSACL
jgi:hypothetical protein